MDSTVAATLRIPDYELLRLVGRGSYGEVWMARNALGSLRAVKVVWRRNFEEERPYEREFHGIRKFEPVSRKHEGLVDVYHVGRNNEDGYFYYVMELADDAALAASTGAVPGSGAGAERKPESTSNEEYRPQTLREEIRTRGRMSVSRSLDIGAKLASALDHLHRASLVHRDVKPSNIIFVGGVPKLADIGLVAGISDARSYVGTEGFVPPEGPGSPSADIYSLGKVLYEMSTGRDRNEFPKLPPVGGATGINPQEFAEFNEVLLKACEPLEKARYRTAGELFGDLVFLQGGKSLRRVRGLERRTAFLTKLGIAAAILALLTSVGYFGSFKQIQRAERAERQAVARVERLEMQKAEELFQRDDSGGALARLAHILRTNPTNRVAAERLMWALTWRNFPLPEAEPIQPSKRVVTAAFRPDGSEIVAGSANGLLEAWDVALGKPSWQFQTSGAELFTFAWALDQTQMALGTPRDGYLFDPIERKVRPLGLAVDSHLTSIEFSADARWILTGGHDGNARIFDARTGETEKILAHGSRLRRAAFRPNGQHVATAGHLDGAARLWDTVTGDPASPILRHGTRINQLRFSPDGRILATAADDSSARLWRVPSGAVIGRLGHRAQVTDLVFSPDGGKIATASEDGTAMLWDVETLQPIGSPLRHRAWVKELDFSPDGLKLVSASEDNTTRAWDANTGQPLSEPMRHPDEVVSVDFAPHEDRLLTASAGMGSSLWLWKTTLRGAKSDLIPVTGTKRSARYQRESGRLSVASERAVRSWSLDDLRLSPVTIDLGVPVDFINLSASSNRAVVVSGTQAWIWDLANKQAVKGPISHGTAVIAAELSPNANQVALATAGGNLTLWAVNPAPADRLSQPCLPQPGQPERTPEGSVFSVRFSPDGRWLAAACRDRKCRVFEAATGRLHFELSHDHWVVDVDFSPDSRRLATASSDRNARLWDGETGRQIGAELRHDNDVVMVRFSPDGRRVATASRDWTARVWDSQTGRPVSEPLLHGGPVQVISFSPDGDRVATGSLDETARIWDSDTGLALTDPFHYAGPVENVAFTANGAKLLVVPASGDIHLIETPRSAIPAPAWLPDLAEAVARQRLDRQLQTTLAVPAEALFQLKRELSTRDAADPMIRWANWFLDDPDRRPMAPSSTTGRGDYIAKLVRTSSPAGLREALWLNPTNALAHALLARELIRHDQYSSRDRQEADWRRRYAAQLDPQNSQVAEVCNSVALRLRALGLLPRP